MSNVTAREIFLLKIGVSIDAYFKKSDITKFNAFYNKYGSIRFAAALEDTYKDICIGAGGNLRERKIQLKFLERFEIIIKRFATKRTREALTNSAFNVCEKFRHSNNQQITELLTNIVICCKRSNIRETEIVELLQTTEELAYVVHSYNEWKGLAETLVA